MIPNAILVKIIDVPPLLTKGSVKPVTGKIFTATAILIKACNTREKLNPTAMRAPNAFGLLRTILMAR